MESTNLLNEITSLKSIALFLAQKSVDLVKERVDVLVLDSSLLRSLSLRSEESRNNSDCNNHHEACKHAMDNGVRVFVAEYIC